MNDKTLFQNAFDTIDDELIAEAKSPKIRILARRKRIIISSVAACIAAVLIAIPSIKIISDLNVTNIKIITEYDTAYDNNRHEQQNSSGSQSGTNNSDGPRPQSSANNSTPSSSGDISHAGLDGSVTNDVIIKPSDLYFTGAGDSGGWTESYEKIYSPSVEYLYINPIPNNKYATIYKGYYGKEISRQQALSLADEYFPKIANLLNTATPEYIIYSYSSYVEIVDKFENNDYYGISMGVTNDLNRNTVRFYDFKKPLTLDGETFYIHKDQSDTEIINSLSDLKIKLFDLFKVSFTDAKVIRHYDGVYDAYVVYLYNSQKHPLNDLSGDSPYTDYISIAFNNYDNEPSDIYYVSNIWYWSFRTENSSHSKPIAQKEILPLEKAEEYLSKGYVLTYRGCPACQGEQSPVDFTNYDYVSFEYKGGINVGDLTIPYYAFYKNIGIAENGNMIFAKTYVPAIEVEGYEEYFENKHANHSN